MASDETQRKLYEFLCHAYREHRLFTVSELEETTGWSGATFKTYYPKQLKGLLVKEDDGTGVKYRVNESFLRYPSFEKFKELVTQVRRVAEDYKLFQFDSVVIYDFFMPLSNEDYLRRALDALFFKDTLMDKLKRLLRDVGMEVHFPRNNSEADEEYLNRVLLWVDASFGGYSIMHVSGRFKASPLMTAAEAGKCFNEGGRYLVDETTAVARFIFPLNASRRITSDNEIKFSIVTPSEEVLAEADMLSWFFSHLFIESIINVISGQDEIWMLESGLRSRLHVWKVG
ncbi:MAG: hypothetical protein AB9903_12265 [Vulcanimicrobiota bacterium]